MSTEKIILPSVVYSALKRIFQQNSARPNPTCHGESTCVSWWWAKLEFRMKLITLDTSSILDRLSSYSHILKMYLQIMQCVWTLFPPWNTNSAGCLIQTPQGKAQLSSMRKQYNQRPRSVPFPPGLNETKSHITMDKEDIELLFQLFTREPFQLLSLQSQI